MKKQMKIRRRRSRVKGIRCKKCHRVPLCIVGFSIRILEGLNLNIFSYGIPLDLRIAATKFLWNPSYAYSIGLSTCAQTSF